MQGGDEEEAEEEERKAGRGHRGDRDGEEISSGRKMLTLPHG
jgi:hypothetical protein